MGMWGVGMELEMEGRSRKDWQVWTMKVVRGEWRLRAEGVAYAWARRKRKKKRKKQKAR